MSIAGMPYPSGGVNHCVNVYQAERIIEEAVEIDGDGILDRVPGLRDVLEDSEGDVEDGVPPYYFKSKLGISKVRPLVGQLWRVMSDKAKTAFACSQVHAGMGYLSGCLIMLQALDPDKYQELLTEWSDFFTQFSKKFCRCADTMHEPGTSETPSGGGSLSEFPQRELPSEEEE